MSYLLPLLETVDVESERLDGREPVEVVEPTELAEYDRLFEDDRLRA